MDVLFQHNEATALVRVVEIGATPIHSTTWGALKSAYRY
jgi:hypothetical protein